MGVEFGIVDISLAPTIAEGDSVAEILRSFGIEHVGAPGSTMAVALLMDAVKRGGAMASANVGGLSGTFIPISEDKGMIRAVKAKALSLENSRRFQVSVPWALIWRQFPALRLKALSTQSSRMNLR